MINIECFATIGQVGNLDHENVSIGKAGRVAVAGQAAARARRRDEPGRPSARRRRRQDLGRPSSGVAVGPADQGLQDAQPQDRPTSSSFSGDRSNGPITQKRPVRRHAPAREDRGDESRGRQEGHQDVVAPLDRRARDGGPHARRAQREEVHPGVHHREHGRPQARRVRADAASSKATRRKVAERAAAAAARRPAGPGAGRSGARRRRRRGGGAKPAGQGASHDSGAGNRALRAHVGPEGRARARV